MRRIATLTISALLVASSCTSDGSSSPSTPDSSPESDSTDAELAVPASSDGVAPNLDAPSDVDSSASTRTQTNAADVDDVTAPSTTEPGPLTEDDLTLFIAAAERTLEGSAQESAVFDDPAIYIALGQASCDRFSEGDQFDRIAIELLADIESGELEDEPRLVGSILGAATQTLCPEHADKI